MNAPANIDAATIDTVSAVRPRSAVSGGVGVAGLVGLGLWLGAARAFGMDGPFAALTAVLACGVPMVAWSLLVDKVHRNPTTGIDWARVRPIAETIDISLVKIAGLWATWAVIAGLYCVARWYWDGQYLFAMGVLGWGSIPLLALSVPYVIWLDRRLVEPRDGAWHLGRLVAGKGLPADREILWDHARAWAVKGFFLAFMISIVPGNWTDVVRPAMGAILSSPLDLARWLIAAMFLIDVAFATVGYMLTMKPLDAHIRSANPHAAGWTAALICYPPFALMYAGGPLDYHSGTADYVHWLEGYPLLTAAVAFVLVALTAVYAWATVAFGLRFSNLTHRGILTHGPYAWTKHPAYVSKNLFWWIGTLPFLSVNGSFVEMVRNTAILGIVTGVYYWRARTEERHLSEDADYRAYSDWMAAHGPVARVRQWWKSHSQPTAMAAE